MATLKDFIVRTYIGNTDENYKSGNHAFDTRDFVYLDSEEEIRYLNCIYDRVCYASDYAVMNGAKISTNYTKLEDRKTTSQCLRSANYDDSIHNINCDGVVRGAFLGSTSIGICPVLHLNISAVIYARKVSQNFKIEPHKDKNGKIQYHTIEFGSYPQDIVEKSVELSLLEREGECSSRTGKYYNGWWDGDDLGYQLHPEYEYEGRKYVKVYSKKEDKNSEYKGGLSAPETGSYLWAEVQPIKWRIRNWDELPKELNPEGKGTAKTIFVKSEDALFSGVHFNNYNGKPENAMWQNSYLRAYLNSYDLHEEIRKGNGNKKYISEDYIRKGHGFLDEAFDATITKTISMDNSESTNGEMETQQQKRKSRLEKLNPDKTPVGSRRKMTDTETIKSWIDAGQSVLLRGPSGIGKTERLKKLYPDLIYIKLTNNMFPEKVVGSMNLQTGQSIPPAFAKQAFMACATEEERKLIEGNIQNLYELADTIYERSKSAKGKVVILLDELLNVKPAVQSLVYTLVLNRLVEIEKGLKLPANTVVVATGNQKKYSTVAEDLAEPLEKRFDHILDMEPKVGEWLYEFAIPNKIHPSVIGYIFSKYKENGKGEKLSDIGYFYEEPEIGENNLDRNGCRGRTNDPRGWESVSRTLYAFEEDLKNGKFVGKDVEALLKISIGSKLRDEWAEEFFDFYNNPTLTVEEVVGKKYTQADLPITINERFATMLGLLGASTKQVGDCREFIRKYCAPDYLAVYDMYWAGENEERMEKIAELKELQITQTEDEGEGSK